MYLFHTARLEPEWNLLGVEIRAKLTQLAQANRDESDLRNLHYLYGNINVHFGALLASLPKGVLRRVSLLFPDPWYKRKHIKRRVVQPRLIDELGAALPPGGEFLVETDVRATAEDMWQVIRASGWFEELPSGAAHSFARLDESTATKRADYLVRGMPLFRKVYRRAPVRLPVQPVERQFIAPTPPKDKQKGR